MYEQNTTSLICTGDGLGMVLRKKLCITRYGDVAISSYGTLWQWLSNDRRM
ncbi:MAG: hypothetical protein ACJ0AW_04335 [Gammaproteobacteria bacterium]